MCFAARRAPAYSLPFLALLILATVGLEGCGGQNSSREQEFLKNNPKNAPQEAVAKFSGHVSVDGLPTLGSDQLFVFLADPQHFEPKKKAKYSTTVKPDGSFEFTTYFPGDGVPPGKYIVGFVALRTGRKTGGRADTPVPYRGPDGLKNRYNDPDKNKEMKEFAVDVTEPGRTDYEFNLTLAGKDPGTLGEHSVKSLGEAPSDL
jgi:hypothetical protein